MRVCLNLLCLRRLMYDNVAYITNQHPLRLLPLLHLNKLDAPVRLRLPLQRLLEAVAQERVRQLTHDVQESPPVSRHAAERDDDAKVRERDVLSAHERDEPRVLDPRRGGGVPRADDRLEPREVVVPEREPLGVDHEQPRRDARVVL